MELTDLREQIERSLPILSFDDLTRVSVLIDDLLSPSKPKISESNQQLNRLQWLERLQENRSKLSSPSDRQSVLEMREEERY